MAKTRITTVTPGEDGGYAFLQRRSSHRAWPIVAMVMADVPSEAADWSLLFSFAPDMLKLLRHLNENAGRLFSEQGFEDDFLGAGAREILDELKDLEVEL